MKNGRPKDTELTTIGLVKKKIWDNEKRKSHFKSFSRNDLFFLAFFIVFGNRKAVNRQTIQLNRGNAS